MAGTGGARKGAGRPKGVVGKTKRIKAIAAAVAVKSKGKGPLKSKDGISPKDVMLQAMRDAWDKAHGLQADADKAQREADKLPDGSPEREAKHGEATLLRVAARHSLEDATGLAAQAAPYIHPKLANLDSKITGSITVERAKF